MRFLFVILFLCSSSTSWSAEHYEKRKGGLQKLAADYLDAMKTLSNTLMTTPGVTPKVKPDIIKAEKLNKATNILMTKYKGDKLGEDKASKIIKTILCGVRGLDKDLQKMGTFDNGALNTARINAVQRSNRLMAMLLRVSEVNAAEEASDDVSTDEASVDEETRATEEE